MIDWMISKRDEKENLSLSMSVDILIMSFQKVVPLGKEMRWYDGLLLRQGTV